MAFPPRPRLAEHVLARRHVVDGEERVVIHDTRTARLVQIGPREWGLLAAADGTRDLDGIVLAAAREGAHARVPALRAFLEQLHQAGLLDDGLPAVETSGDDTERAAPASVDHARPLVPLPGFSLHCDGSGTCCRIYASVIFGPVEAVRARALLPLVQDGGLRHERIFMPDHGSAPTGGAAVLLRDGRCAYLAGDDRCGLHAAGGPGAKPVGCNTFPAWFVDDGESVRVSVSVECACVLASVGREGGAPLVPESAKVRGDLDGTLFVARLPEQVRITTGSSATRAAYLAWTRRVEGLPPAADTAAHLWGLAASIDVHGVEPAAIDETAGRPPGTALRPWIEALGVRAARRAQEDAAWRSERDLARRATRWIAQTAAFLIEPDAIEVILGAPIVAASSEEFYLRASLHGHRFCGELPLLMSLRDHAVRIVMARAMAQIFARLPASELDPACAHPLALVEAMLRGHGLDAYAHDVAAG